MAEKRWSFAKRLLLAGVLLLIGAAGLWTYQIWKHPLAAHVKKTRRALEAAGLEKAEAQLAGRRLVYWQGGEGPTLVLLHGAGDQAGTWFEIVPTLLRDYRLLIPDLPGHGESEPEAGPLPMEEILAGLEALVDERSQEGRLILVGNSMGAWLATLEAYRHPESVSRVVLVNGGAVSGDPNNPSLVPVDREAARQLMDMLRDPASPKIPGFVLDDIVRRSASGPIGRMLQDPESFMGLLLDGRLGEISTPVDMVWGESDRLMSLSYAERMLAELPRARLTGVPACGHIPQSECPERLAEALLAVLESDPPASEVLVEPASETGLLEEEASDDPR